ncbi:AAA domain-containing protein [Pseudactinotalea sp. HY160]|uniref:AAA family ATPase n=1 Tax=Pseudactinotalea sp. HY160 TaxID=2654490 RepID=UPI00128E5E52|nr:AAA family ATPase [Pseudactinotalea sp. HY160]MPV49528.1 AAA domain-containing protein [Pseudactinotalea sp. HY160]
MTSATLTLDLTGLERSLARSLHGRPEVVRLASAVFLARGHLLLEDVPGVGKTTLAKALARAVGGTVGRIQFTPDLLPSDLTGITIYRQQLNEFEFRPGPLFATVVIGDEINRASPKTQSALLEAMQERQVTVDGTTHALPEPFMVIATQNPVEMAGTYPLPEAQRDRFMAQTSIGYPDAEHELRVLTGRPDAEHAADAPHGGNGSNTGNGGNGSNGSNGTAASALDPGAAAAAIDQVSGVYVAEAVHRYVLALVRATRDHADVALGASPRAGLHLVALARAWAALAGRDFVLPDDIQDILVPVLGHRLALTREARSAGRTPAQVLAELRAQLPVP